MKTTYTNNKIWHLIYFLPHNNLLWTPSLLHLYLWLIQRVSKHITFTYISAYPRLVPLWNHIPPRLQALIKTVFQCRKYLNKSLFEEMTRTKTTNAKVSKSWAFPFKALYLTRSINIRPRLHRTFLKASSYKSELF